MSPRTLHEIYLEPFRRALAGHGVASIMGSYNRVNGEYVCQSRELLALPRTRWGWAGVCVPDFIFAVRDPRAALLAGLDLPALGGNGGRTEADVAELGDERLDELVLHVLTAAEQVGLRRPPNAVSDPPAGSAELARRIVADGMVLLHNREAVLPLSSQVRVALIDAVGVRNVLVMGGAPSVSLVDERISSVAGCLESALSSSVSVQTVGPGEAALPPLEPEAGRVVDAVVRDTATGTEHRRTLDLFALAEPEGVGTDWSADIRTRLRAPRAGRYTVTLEFGGRATLYAADRPMVSGFREASPMVFGPEYPLHAVLDLDAEQEVELRVAYETSVAISVPGLPVQPHVRLGVAGPNDELGRAVALAADSDIALVLAGRISGEAMDVDSLRLPGRQEEVVAAVAAANPRTILVTLSANPVILPKVELAAVLHAWFPGEQFAEALAVVLTGAAEPVSRCRSPSPPTRNARRWRRPASIPA